jgi:hypothetical protein
MRHLISAGKGLKLKKERSKIKRTRGAIGNSWQHKLFMGLEAIYSFHNVSYPLKYRRDA